MTENDTGRNADDDHDGREASDVEYDKDKEYEIERVVSAVKAGRGWMLQVKWAGYPGTTPEPLSACGKKPVGGGSFRWLGWCCGS